MKQHADVIVIGGGHAGLEAAHAAARMGSSVILVTHRRDRIGEMSCNPAIGGVGKGHLVREIDALDGVMGKCADAAAIHYRLLNVRKGPAVQGPRAQCDRARYRRAASRVAEATPRLRVVEASVDDLLIDDHRAEGVILADGVVIRARAVVLTAGTFLGGMMHVGHAQAPGGRFGDPAAVALAARLRMLELPVGRLKTGTPPRLDGRTIDWDALARQPGDSEPTFLSFATEQPANPQVDCAITHTNARCHDVIRAHLAQSAIYGGAISGSGPRYCPSVEDKVVRFAEKPSHQIFLEPEGLDDPTVYPNGISTSLPAEAQALFVATIAGLERARIIRPGYAIEYDYVSPVALDATLALKAAPGLFLAGQINGTTGYEEAAAQGLVAGLNAALLARGQQPRTFPRAESYIGVMIDDLVTRGVSEPYRMFTSRAEYRLSLRPDNADQRLTPQGVTIGCVSPLARERFERKMDLLARMRSESAQDAHAIAADAVQRECRRTLAAEQLYAGYTERQHREAAQLARDDLVLLPPGMSYDAMPGLSSELRSKLQAVRPRSLAQAARVEGMTPAALMLVAGAARRADAAAP